jgi:sRNA-binding carbon storage regulator CsrA
MLVLTRREGDGIRLTLPDGTACWVKVLEVGGAVRLGFDFPREIVIERGELIPAKAGKEGRP